MNRRKWSGAASSRCPAVAAQIGRDHRVSRGERGDDAPPAVVRLGKSVQQEHGLSPAGRTDEVIGVANRKTPVGQLGKLSIHHPVTSARSPELLYQTHLAQAGSAEIGGADRTVRAVSRSGVDG